MFGNGFYNPYMYQPHYQAGNFARNLGGLTGTSNLSSVGSGLASGNAIGSGLSGLLSKFNFTGFLDGASKTLNVVNQAIPIFYQVRPIINNAKTMFRIIGAVKDDGSSKNTVVQTTRSNETIPIVSNDDSQRSPMNQATIVEDEPSTDNPVFFI